MDTEADDARVAQIDHDRGHGDGDRALGSFREATGARRNDINQQMRQVARALSTTERDGLAE
jgi:hypothetical protein